jgi:hypothetical protein
MQTTSKLPARNRPVGIHLAVTGLFGQNLVTPLEVLARQSCGGKVLHRGEAKEIDLKVNFGYGLLGMSLESGILRYLGF